METQHESKDICRSMGGSVRDNKTYFHDMDHSRRPKPRNLPKEEPLAESSDDSEFEGRNNNERRYPERKRRPPEQYMCN